MFVHVKMLGINRFFFQLLCILSQCCYTWLHSHKYVIERKLQSCINARRRHSWNSSFESNFQFSHSFTYSLLTREQVWKTFIQAFTHDTEKTPPNAKSNPINQHENPQDNFSRLLLQSYLFITLFVHATHKHFLNPLTRNRNDPNHFCIKKGKI